jgi:hypothetical protein
MTLLWMAAISLLAAPGAPSGVDPGFCDQDQPSHCSTPIQRGQAAIFEGQLLTTDLAITLGMKAANCDARIALEVDFAKKMAEVDLVLEKKLREIDGKSAVDSIQLMQKRLDEAVVPVYERPWFVAGVTFVLTVGAFSLAVWGAGQLSGQ